MANPHTCDVIGMCRMVIISLSISINGTFLVVVLIIFGDGLFLLSLIVNIILLLI